MGRIRQWYYRGSLRSCNYACSYCPFSKRSHSEAALRRDRERLFRFVSYMRENKEAGGAVQIVPYGEALIHPYYWEALAALSRSGRIDAVGAQSNFSFPVEKMLSVYEERGGAREKLRLWGTFHPAMTSAEDFAGQCRKIRERNVTFCAGAVGVPENISEIQRLRELLPNEIYLWINRMDGLKRSYTETEKQAFLAIDPYFSRELLGHRADDSRCTDSVFVEADGTLKGCVLCHRGFGNLYEGGADKTDFACVRKECGCYMAYNNQGGDEFSDFGTYPAFRVPE